MRRQWTSTRQAQSRLGLNAAWSAWMRAAIPSSVTTSITTTSAVRLAALTSAFSAAFDLSQRNTESALTYPSVSDTASAAVGREMSQTGEMISRRNLNVQPTIKAVSRTTSAAGFVTTGHDGKADGFVAVLLGGFMSSEMHEVLEMMDHSRPTPFEFEWRIRPA